MRRPLLLLLAGFAVGPAPAAPPAPDPARVASFAELALRCIDRPFPNKPEHVLDGPESVRAPREFHPVFYGCYDWHSALHGHWMLVRLARLQPDHPVVPRIREALERQFTPEALRAEAAYFDVPSQRLFERTYGWGWALRLAAELRGWDDPQARRWAAAYAPLEARVAALLEAYLPKLAAPIRTGVHPNTAFALAQALDYARAVGDRELEQLIVRRARDYYGADRACPVDYEPSGEDFFSPCLAEADLMRRVLDAREFSRWLDGFLPGLRRGRLGHLAQPAVVTDPTDGKIVHLDGLNLTRAWTLRGIARALPAKDRRRAVLERLGRAHADAGLARVQSGNYEGEHWLASFAVYLLTEVGP
ncbi:MAG: DUF2891 domain-containing protein [Acidobacteria bacterium]|nr:DUF2891 domain-containing protein [Acidobacteriota bacterium]